MSSSNRKGSFRSNERRQRSINHENTPEVHSSESTADGNFGKLEGASSDGGVNSWVEKGEVFYLPRNGSAHIGPRLTSHTTHSGGRRGNFRPHQQRQRFMNHDNAVGDYSTQPAADGELGGASVGEGASTWTERGQVYYLPQNDMRHVNPHFSETVQMNNFPKHENFQSNPHGYSKKKHDLYGGGSASEQNEVPERQENNFQPTYNFRSSNIDRPQLKFDDEIDNGNTIWVPRIPYKPNALVPLDMQVEETVLGLAYSHPYEYELRVFVPLESHVCYIEPIKPLELHETPYIFVDQPDQLEPLVNDLLSQDSIAIDLEHHSFRSFQGFTCLMQISTLSTDYLIDTIALRSQLNILNEVFTNPNIVKVFHGAKFDIVWLQRDLSLYIVNMFDTYFAAKALQFAQLSLSFLLYYYCEIGSNKGFQMADWRIRPLSEELKNYAREDTHYLLYIYAHLRNALLDAASGNPSLLESVYKSSTEICLRRYYKQILTKDSHLELPRRYKKVFTGRQLRVLKEVYGWRDKLARQEDESTGYVLPNHMLLRICEFLPDNIQSLAACCSPLTPLLESRLEELYKIVSSEESSNST